MNHSTKGSSTYEKHTWLHETSACNQLGYRDSNPEYRNQNPVPYRLAIAHHFQMTIIFIAKIAYESKYPIAFELSFCFICPPISPSIARASAAVAITFKAISISPIIKSMFLFEPLNFISGHISSSCPKHSFLFLKNFWKFSCDSQRESELL